VNVEVLATPQGAESDRLCKWHSYGLWGCMFAEDASVRGATRPYASLVDRIGRQNGKEMRR